MQDQLNNTLIDVRKAYRLLFEYQDRIKNLVSFIGGHYDFSFSEGYPVFSAHTRNAKNVNLDHWAWDWLSMYFYQFKFTTTKSNITFSIFLLSDSGYYDNKEIAKSKLDTQNFKSAEDSKTKLYFVIGKDMWRYDIVADGNELENKEWETILFNNLKVYGNGTVGKFLVKEFTLDQFLDENLAISSLKDFQHFCKENGVELELKERELQ